MLHRTFTLVGFLGASVAMATPTFSIIPTDSLPTVPGSVAYYTVTNNTPYTLNNNGILPQAHVTQAVGLTDTCASPFSLASKASCVLALDITGLTKGGPTVCNEVDYPARCSMPATRDQLNIMHRGVFFSALSDAMLFQTVDSGEQWKEVTTSAEGFFSGACDDDLCVAGGIAFALYETNENGTDWDDITLGSTNGAFHATSCSGEWCIATGGGYGGLPTIAERDPVTQTWGFISNPDPWPGSNYFFTASCSEDLCMASGYDDGGDIFIAEKTVGGSWNVPVIGSYIVDVKASACTGTWCIVVGDHYSDTVHAVLYQRDPQTGDWSDISSLIRGMPSGSSFFNGASCSDHICVAAGTSLAQSTNQGKTWKVQLPDVSGTFYSTSCTGKFCVAAGTNNQGLVVQTSDAGKHWKIATVSGMPSDAIFSNFNTSSCSGNYCILSGGYVTRDDMEEAPLIAQTTDGGQHWAVLDVTLPSMGEFNAAASQ